MAVNVRATSGYEIGSNSYFLNASATKKTKLKKNTVNPEVQDKIEKQWP